jgi:protein required for attachment to host cells
MNMGKKISVPNGALVVVADYSKALLLRNNGSAIAPTLETKRVIDAPDNPPARAQGSDRPGRAASGSHRSAVEQTDWHTLAGKRFMGEAAKAIEKACGDGFDAVVLIAPPRALADLRDVISDSVRAAVVGELDKDLTGMPIDDIARHLAS